MSENVVEISTLKELQEFIQNETKLCVVDFYANWCAPCKVMLPVLTQVAAEHSEVMVLVKVNIEVDPEVSQHFGIRSIPTLLFMKDGRKVDTRVGTLQKPQLDELIRELA